VTVTRRYGDALPIPRPASRRIQLTWPDGFNVQYDYDMAGELVDVREYGQSGHAEDFAYNDLGQRTSRIS
jgi:YD repeat-containing protein